MIPNQCVCARVCFHFSSFPLYIFCCFLILYFVNYLIHMNIVTMIVMSACKFVCWIFKHIHYTVLLVV